MYIVCAAGTGRYTYASTYTCAQHAHCTPCMHARRHWSRRKARSCSLKILCRARSPSSRGQEGRSVLTYMHVYIRTYVRTYIQVLTAEEQSTYMHAYMHARIHACLPTLMHACMHTYIGLDGDRAESRTLRTPDRPPAKEPRGRTLPWRPVLQEAKLLREEKVVCESGEGCVGRARGWRWMGDSLYNT